MVPALVDAMIPSRSLNRHLLGSLYIQDSVRMLDMSWFWDSVHDESAMRITPVRTILIPDYADILAHSRTGRARAQDECSQ